MTTESSVRTAKPRRDQLRDGVVDFWVVVIGATCKNNTVSVVLLDPRKSPARPAVHLVLDVDIFLPCSLNSASISARVMLAGSDTSLGVLLAVADEQYKRRLSSFLSYGIERPCAGWTDRHGEPSA